MRKITGGLETLIVALNVASGGGGAEAETMGGANTDERGRLMHAVRPLIDGGSDFLG